MQNQRKIDVYLFSKEDVFDNATEGKLRRILKNALELNDVKYINSPIDENIKIVHFLNYKDYGMFNYFRNKKFIKVVSVFRNESDRRSRLIYKKKDPKTNEEELYINKGDVDILNNFDYVFAPSLEGKKLLLENEVKAEIEILPPTVKLTKVKLEDTEIVNVCYIYFHLEKNNEFFLVPFDYKDEEAAKNIIKLATSFSNYKFIVYSQEVNAKETKKVKKIFKKHPGNLILAFNLEEDVYYSTLYNSKGVILLNETPFFVEEIYEAFASKKPILALESSVFKDLYVDKRNSHVYNNFALLLEGVNELINKKLPDLSQNEYEEALQNRIQIVGEKLANLYIKILKEKELL